MVEFARIWRAMPKIGYSRTLERAPWKATVVRDVISEDVLALKARPGGDLFVGGADLAATFMRLGLINEYRIYVHPVVLGAGKQLFPASATRTALRLGEARRFGNGVVLLRYARQPERATDEDAAETERAHDDLPSSPTRSRPTTRTIPLDGATVMAGESEDLSGPVTPERHCA